MVADWRPDAIGFSCNYLANVPEIVDLAKSTKARLPGCFIFLGGHSAWFRSRKFIEQGDGPIDCVLRGEGGAQLPPLLEAIEHDRHALKLVPGAVSVEGEGPPPG